MRTTIRPRDETGTNQVDTCDRDAAVPSRKSLLSALVMVRSKYGRPADSNLLLPETSGQMSSLARPSRSRSQTIAKSRRLRSRVGISSRPISSATSACRDRAWSAENPAVAAGDVLSLLPTRFFVGLLEPWRERLQRITQVRIARAERASLRRPAVSGVLVVQRPRQTQDAGEVLHVVAAEARVEARKHGRQP